MTYFRNLRGEMLRPYMTCLTQLLFLLSNKTRVKIDQYQLNNKKTPTTLIRFFSSFNVGKVTAIWLLGKLRHDVPTFIDF